MRGKTIDSGYLQKSIFENGSTVELILPDGMGFDGHVMDGRNLVLIIKYERK